MSIRKRPLSGSSCKPQVVPFPQQGHLINNNNHNNNDDDKDELMTIVNHYPVNQNILMHMQSCHDYNINIMNNNFGTRTK